MNPNPILKKLGFAPNDRLLIIHADDIGMCQATLPAFEDLVQFGLVTSGAVMAPCPWFPAAAAFCRQNPAVDMGIHITLNSEWDSYRWRPLSAAGANSGLIDEDGYFFRTSAETQENASTEAVWAEMETQVSRALSAGIQATHLDTHMGTVLHPKFLPPYVQLALQYHLPLLMMRWDEEAWKIHGVAEEAAKVAAAFTLQLEELGIPMHDGLLSLDLATPGQHLQQAKKAIDSIPAGLSRLYIHPSCDTPEARAVSPDWFSRVADYQVFMSEEMRAYIQGSGVQLIGYRDIQKAGLLAG
jgi:chitin disaccharide deacetylase